MNRPPLARSVALGLTAWLLVAGLATAAPNTALVSDGVTYYAAVGDFGSAHLVNQADDRGPTTMDFQGCLLAKLRPEKGLGLVRLIGLVHNTTYFEGTFDDFLTPDGVTPAVVTNLTLDGRFDQSPAVRTSAAAWGTAAFTLDAVPFNDPLSDKPDFKASFMASRDGVRDENGAIQTTAERNADEVHLRLQSLAPQGQAESFTITPPGDLPDGSFSPNEAYGFRTAFTNSKLGGTATAHLEATATALDGANELVVTLSAPSGAPLANVTLAPSLLTTAAQDLEFPLSEFGDYSIDVRGKVSLAKYHIDVTLNPPKAVDLDFWWEDVTYGQDVMAKYSACQKQIGYATVPGTVTERHDPPSFLLEIVLVAVVAGTAGVLLAVKLVSESVSSLRFKRQGGR